MQSRTSYFNKAIFLNSLRRVWPLWLAYLAVWGIILPGVEMANIHVWGQSVFSRARDLLELCKGAGVIVGMAYGILAAMAVWSFLYNSKTMSGIASLPVKREGVFLSVSLAGILPAIVSNIIVFGLTMLIHAAGDYAGAVVYDLLGFAVVTMMLIFFYGFALLCAQLTGNIVALPLVYIVLNFTAWIVESLSLLIMDTISYGVAYGGTGLSVYLSPVLGMFDGGPNYERVWNAAYAENEIVGLHYDGLGFLGACCVVGMLFAALALALYRRRRMESAGDVVAVQWLKPVFKYCLCFGCALVSGVGFWGILVQNLVYTPIGETLGILFFMLFGAFVGYFAAEMLLRKSFRVFRGRWKGLFCALAVIIVCVLGFEFDLLGIERRIPDAEDVEGVQIFASDSVLLTEPENIEAAIAVHRLAVEGKSFHEWGSGYSTHFSVNYILKGDKTLSRSYSLRYDVESLEGLGDMEALEALQNCAEAREWRTSLPFEPTEENVLDGRYKGFATAEELIAANPDMSEEDLIIIEYYGYDKHYVVNEMSEAEKLQLINDLKKYQDMPVFFGKNQWDFTGEEMWELYTQCILPDVAEGLIGNYWIVEDEEYMESVCSGRIYIDFWYYPSEAAESEKVYAVDYVTMEAAAETPLYLGDSDKDGYTFSVTPTLGSRSYQWLSEHGVSLHTLQEEYELTEGYTQYPRYG